MRTSRTLIATVAGLCILGAIALPASADTQPSSTDPALDARIAAAVGKLDQLGADALVKTGVPGMAIAVVRGDQLLYAKGFGVRKAGTSDPVTADTVFQLASVSKSIGASVVAAAVGKGIASWQDRVMKYLPSFKLRDPYVTKTATIADMYAMRSGLPYQSGDVLEAIGYNRSEIMQRISTLPLSPFRLQHLYTNFGLTIGAEAVAAAAHKPWESLSEDLLYKPLGMTATSSTYVGFISHPNRTSLHVPINGTWQAIYTRNADAQSPAGGVSSNVLDLSKWMRMEMDHGRFGGAQIVGPKALAAAQTAQIRTTPVGDAATIPRWYGSGMAVSVDRTGQVRLTHSGAFSAGAGTTYIMAPASRLGIVVLANGLIGLPEAVAESFMDLVQTGSVSRDWFAVTKAAFGPIYDPNPQFTADKQPSNPSSDRELSNYVGTYSNDFFGKVTVTRLGTSLRVSMGPNKVVISLRHWTADQFVGLMGAGDFPYEFAVDFYGTRTRVTGLNLGFGSGNVEQLTRVA
ncbi:MAG: serine hydrolase [Actinomycetota bacterium]|nr:serine hydrolase [Actinomycetota bacterium]